MLFGGAGGVATLDCVSHWSTYAYEAGSWGGRTGVGGCRVVVEAEVGADE